MMNTIYTRSLLVDPSMCDFSGRMAVADIFALFQNIASEHAEELGVGFRDMSARGKFWLTVRTRVRFHRRPGLMRTVQASTWPAAPGTNRCDRFYRMCDGERVLAEGRTEWCVYDVARGAACPSAEAGFKEGLVFSDERVLDAPYARFRHDFAEDDLACVHTVRPSDVDVGQHMNNVAYLRMLMDSFSVERQRAMEIQEMEILFCLPCFEGDRLDVMRRETADGYEFGVRRPDGRYAALALLRENR